MQKKKRNRRVVNPHAKAKQPAKQTGENPKRAGMRGRMGSLQSTSKVIDEENRKIPGTRGDMTMGQRMKIRQHVAKRKKTAKAKRLYRIK